MSLFSNHPKLLFYPEIPSGGAPNESKIIGGGKDLSVDDMADFLKDDDDKEVIDLPDEDKGKEKGKDKDKEKGKTKDKKEDETPDEGDEVDKEKEKEDEEEDELKALEEELQEPTEEQLELVTPVARREILKKYPNIFKDFPYLEKAYYREQQFTEIFPHPDDAKAALESKEILDRFESDVMQGNIGTVLKSVKEDNPQGFYKIADNYLTTLANVDEKAYLHVVGNMTKHTIITMIQEARRLGVGQDGEGKALPGNALQMAAQVLNQFIFGSSEFQPPRNLSTEPRQEDKSKENEIQRREREFVTRQFETSRNDLNTRVNNALKNTIDANIDPNKTMTDYVRRNASREAMEQLESLLSKDTRFRSLTDKLWERAFKEGFTKESTDRIRSAFVSKARTLLPSVIKKARNEALRGMGRRVKEEEENTDRRGPIQGGRPRSQESHDERPRSGKIKEAKDIPAGMSTLEFLNSD